MGKDRKGLYRPNMSKARLSWVQVSIILGRDRSNPWGLGMFFNGVVQAVFIFGLEMWVMTPYMGWDLGGSSSGRTERLKGGSPGGFWVEVGINPY